MGAAKTGAQAFIFAAGLQDGAGRSDTLDRARQMDDSFGGALVGKRPKDRIFPHLRD